MPSFCHNLSSHYAHLRTLTDEFTMTYERVKDSGDLTEVRRLKIQLEEARDALTEQLGIFRVPDAMNPYHEALLVAGLDQNETHERQEMTVNIREEIRRQLQLYREVTDSNDQPVLEEWINDITQNLELLFAEVAKNPAKIKARIKAGMIPIVMPSRRVQERTWKKAMTHLKPCLIEKGEMLYISDTYIGFDDGTGRSPPSFPTTIPERPYLVWTKPTQKPEPVTWSTSIEIQQEYNNNLVTDWPELYDRVDITPTEYSALQYAFTYAVRERYQSQRGFMSDPTYLLPLDMNFDTLLLVVGTEDNQEISVRFNYADHLDTILTFKTTLWDDKEQTRGFRPASRT